MMFFPRDVKLLCHFSMLTPAEAEKIIFETVAPFPREDCPLGAAHGRVLRADICADRDLPPFDRVTMDGYALRATSLATGTRTFQLQATQAAGMRPFQLGPNEDACIEIMTGAVLPQGADCVVPLEETVREGPAVTITLPETGGDRRFICRGSLNSPPRQRPSRR
jgi:molybdopterin molybdotransferase